MIQPTILAGPLNLAWREPVNGSQAPSRPFGQQFLRSEPFCQVIAPGPQGAPVPPQHHSPSVGRQIVPVSGSAQLLDRRQLPTEGTGRRLWFRLGRHGRPYAVMAIIPRLLRLPGMLRLHDLRRGWQLPMDAAAGGPDLPGLSPAEQVGRKQGVELNQFRLGHRRRGLLHLSTFFHIIHAGHLTGSPPGPAGSQGRPDAEHP